PRPADRRRQGEGAGGTPGRDQRSDPAEAEREERQRGSDAGAAPGADRAPGVDHRRSARARAAAGGVRRPAGEEGGARRAPGSTGELKVVYSARYRIDIGPHVFPTEKYQRVHARLLETGVIQPADVVEPGAASWDELALVHTAGYLEKMREGTLSPEDVAQLELPWSQAMVDGFRVMTGGTILAARLAVETQRSQSTQSTQIKTSSA